MSNNNNSFCNEVYTHTYICIYYFTQMKSWFRIQIFFLFQLSGLKTNKPPQLKLEEWSRHRQYITKAKLITCPRNCRNFHNAFTNLGWRYFRFSLVWFGSLFPIFRSNRLQSYQIFVWIRLFLFFALKLTDGNYKSTRDK